MSQTHPLTWTAEEIIGATGGELLCGDLHRLFSGVSIDSRDISADNVFVAIIGETHDGHAFTTNSVDLGVRGFVISRHKTGQLPIAECISLLIPLKPCALIDRCFGITLIKISDQIALYSPL